MVGYDSIIEEAARRFNVPASHIRAVMATESANKPGAASPKGAAGLMQIMSPTYNELAKKHQLGPDRFNPRNNILAGTAYIRQLNDQFGGSWDDTFGAYNSGPGRWGLVKAGKQNAPAETTNYIRNVNARLGNAGTGDTVAFNPTIPRLDRPRPGQNLNLLGGPIPENEQDLQKRLRQEIEASQTYTKPPAPPPPAAAPSGLSSRIDDMIASLSKPGATPQAPSQLQYMMAGAQSGMQGLTGVHDRKIGLGEILGALGGGVTSGYFKGNEAQQQHRQSQFGELGNLVKVEDHQIKQATAARQVQAANAYADQIQSVNPALAAALRNNPSLMDEVAKEQARQQFNPTDNRTPLEKNAAAAGLTPGTPAYLAFMEKHAGGGTNINLNTTENKAAGALAEGRVKQYQDIRTKGEAAPKMLQKLDQLETVLNELGTTGPATPTISKLVGWAQQAGIPTAQISEFYKQWTDQNLADPAKVDLASKLIQDFVTNSIKSLGANPTDTDLLTLQQANPAITNQAEANRFIIQNTLRPQYEGERDLWNNIRGLDRTDHTLDTLEDRVYQFQEGKRLKAEEARRLKTEEEKRRADEQKPPEVTGDPPPEGETIPEPGAVWSNKVSGWVKRDPNWKTGMPGSGWLILKK
jgi:hypothetical protein